MVTDAYQAAMFILNNRFDITNFNQCSVTSSSPDRSTVQKVIEIFETASRVRTAYRGKLPLSTEVIESVLGYAEEILEFMSPRFVDAFNLEADEPTVDIADLLNAIIDVQAYCVK